MAGLNGSSCRAAAMTARTAARTSPEPSPRTNPLMMEPMAVASRSPMVASPPMIRPGTPLANPTAVVSGRLIAVWAAAHHDLT